MQDEERYLTLDEVAKSFGIKSKELKDVVDRVSIAYIYMRDNRWFDNDARMDVTAAIKEFCYLIKKPYRHEDYLRFNVLDFCRSPKENNGAFDMRYLEYAFNDDERPHGFVCCF